MMVTWEESDIRSGRRVWKDMECMLCCDPHDWRSGCSLIVIETGRLMIHGSRREVAEYLTVNHYKPTKER